MIRKILAVVTFLILTTALYSQVFADGGAVPEKIGSVKASWGNWKEIPKSKIGYDQQYFKKPVIIVPNEATGAVFQLENGEVKFKKEAYVALYHSNNESCRIETLSNPKRRKSEFSLKIDDAATFSITVAGNGTKASSRCVAVADSQQKIILSIDNLSYDGDPIRLIYKNAPKGVYKIWGNGHRILAVEASNADDYSENNNETFIVQETKNSNGVSADSTFSKANSTITGPSLSQELYFKDSNEFNKLKSKIKTATKNSSVTITIPQGAYLYEYNAFKAFVSESLEPLVGTISFPHELNDVVNSSNNIQERINATACIRIDISRNYESAALNNLISIYTQDFGNVKKSKNEWIVSTNIIGYETLLRNERSENLRLGFGEITNSQVAKQRALNKEAGYGEITNIEVEIQKNNNLELGFGCITNLQVLKQRASNKEAGYGEITDTEVEAQRNENERLGLGRLTNVECEEARAQYFAAEAEKFEKDKALLSKYIEEAEVYKKNKQFCYMLGKYYAASVKEKELNIDCGATTKFKELKDLILQGKPGSADYDDFETYDAWIELLKDSEKYFSENPIFMLKAGELKQISKDMQKRIYVYGFDVLYEESEEYVLFDIIKNGLSEAYDKDWTEIPENWPGVSIYWPKNHGNNYGDLGEGYKQKNSYIINGTPLCESVTSIESKIDERNRVIKLAEEMYMYSGVQSAAGYAGYQSGVRERKENLNQQINDVRKDGVKKIVNLSLLPIGLLDKKDSRSIFFETKFNIVDENEKLLLEGVYKFLDFDKKYEFEVTSDISKKIASGSAKIKLDSVYVHYGLLNSDDNTSEIGNIPKLPKVKVNIKK